MKLILDTADVEALKRLNNILSLDGLTTNPTIITRSGKDFNVVINEIIDILSPEQLLFIQVLATEVDDMVKEATYINNLRPNTYAKIPCSVNGLIAIKKCKALGLKVLATAIYSPEQALMAAKNGADCLAPYVNRMCNNGDGIEAVKDLQKMLENYHLNAYILAASFKNVNQVHELFKAGIEAVTLPVDVCENLYLNPYTDAAIATFTSDWEKAYKRKSLI